MTEKPFQLSAPGMDVLSDALQLFRLSGAVLLRGEFSAPWAFDIPDSSEVAAWLHPGAHQLVVVHIVADGQCWVEVDSNGREILNPGEMVVFPHGHAHLMGSAETAAPVPISRLFPALPWTDLPILTFGGGGALTRIVCAYLLCDQLLFNPFLADLPPMLCARPSDGPALDWLRSSVRYLISETCSDRPGAASLTSRLTELLFIEMIRLHIGATGARDSGWLAALADRYLSRALQAMHAYPGHPWTLNELAKHVGLSRSALTTRFRRCLGQAPMQYLSIWRLQLAAQRLQSTDQSLAMLAVEVGYGSEEAFSRAFKRVAGLPPATWRRERQLHAHYH